MEASVCDNTFETDVEELFLNIKEKNIVLLQFVFIKNIFSTLRGINLFAVL